MFGQTKERYKAKLMLRLLKRSSKSIKRKKKSFYKIKLDNKIKHNRFL